MDNLDKLTEELYQGMTNDLYKSIESEEDEKIFIIKCPNCNKLISIKEDDDEFTCESCEEIYKINWKEEIEQEDHN
ncbi:MAG: hypothetical protein ACOCRK_05445 [bacterium]